MAPTDAELRFKATLDDEVSSKAEKLEKQLKQLGATPAQIKVTLKAVDEATPQLKKAQEQMDRMPRHHVMKMVADTAQTKIEWDRFKEEAKKPIKITFTDNLNEVANKMRVFANKAALPLAGALPPQIGYNLFYGLGAGSLVGAGAGVGALAKNAVGVNSEMEQSMVTLTQTLRDQTRATQEMGKVVNIAQKTPFNYQDVLAADVRLRSYQIPSMKGEGGPKNQGWLKSAGDMAAALNTPITQAVEAIADARQGYFVRLMSYGIRMQREDFAAGGKFAGLTYEQGLERSMKRFQGSQEMQAKTFQGIMSNIHDVLQQQVLRPLGGPAFQLLKEKAGGLQDRLLSPENQRMMGAGIQTVQRDLVQFYNMLQKGKAYFDQNIKQPLTDIAKQAGIFAKTMASAFGGATLTAVGTLGKGFLELAQVVGKVINAVPGLATFMGYMKALSLLGFGNLARPFTSLLNPLNYLTLRVGTLLTSLIQLPGAIAKIGLFFLVKGFLDAHAATQALNNEFHKLSGTNLDNLNGQIERMAGGLDTSATNLKKLTTLAGAGLPSVQFGSEGDRANAALDLAKRAQGIHNAAGFDPGDIIRLTLGEMRRTGDYQDINKMTREAGAAAAALKELQMSTSDAARLMTTFGSTASKVGLGGLPGLPGIAAMSRGLQQVPLTGQQLGQGIYQSDDLLRRALESAAAPSTSMLRQVGGGKGLPNVRNLERYWDFSMYPQGNEAGSHPGRYGRAQKDINQLQDTYAGNERQYRQQVQGLHRLAPMADIPHASNPWLEQHMGTNVDKIMGIQDGVKRAEAIGVAWERNQTILDGVNTKVIALNNALNKLNATANTQQLGINSLNMKMQQWQHDTLVPLQRQIEDQSLALSKYTFENLHPLERQMTRLQQATGQMSFQMNEAQYSMSKWNEGLVTGEQAALDQLHALDQYNKQLQLLQTTYTEIGAQLGQTTYERGYSSRVAPIAGLTLQMQMEKLQREQQRKNLEYELGPGEAHYQMQQAARTRFQRQELPLSQRLSYIHQNVRTIDSISVAQHRMSEVQNTLQGRMFRVNEHIQNQADGIQRLQLKLQALQQSKTARAFEDQQFNLNKALTQTNIAIQQQQIKIDRWQATVDDLKVQGETLGKLFASMLNWDPSKPQANLKRIVDLMKSIPVSAGGWTDKQADAVTQAYDAAMKKHDEFNKKRISSDRNWLDTMKHGILGIFTGETQRLIGSQVRNILSPVIGSTAANIVGGVATVGTIGYTGLVGLGLARTLGAQVFRRGAGGIASALGAGEGTVGRIRGTGWAARYRGQFRVFRRARAVLAGGPLRGLGRLIGGRLGAPGRLFGDWAGGRAADTVAERTTFRQWGRAAKDIKDGSGAFRQGVRNFGGDIKTHARNGSSRLRTFANRIDKFGKQNDSFAGKMARRASSFGEKIKTFGDWVGHTGFGKWVTRFGESGREIAGAVAAFVAAGAIFSKVIDGLKSILSHLPGGLGKKFREAEKAVEEGGTAASKVSRLGRLGGKLGGGLRFLGKLGKFGIGAEALNSLLHGDVSGAVDAGSWLLPGGITAHATNWLYGHVPGAFGEEASSGLTHGNILGSLFFGAGRGDLSGDAPGWKDRLRIRRELQALLQGPALHSPAWLRRHRRRHAGGLNRVPYDGYEAILHQDEAVVPAATAHRLRSGFSETGTNDFVQMQEINLRHHVKTLQTIDEDHKKKIVDKEDEHQITLQHKRKDYRDYEEKKNLDHEDLKLKDIDKHQKDNEKHTDEHFRTLQTSHQNGWQKIWNISDNYITKVEKQVKGIDHSLGLTDNSHNKPPKHAHGGVIDGKHIGRGHLVRVGEEGYPEAIIPLAPHRRSRARELTRQVVSRIGGLRQDIQAFASGGMTAAGPFIDASGHPISELNDRMSNHRVPWPKGKIKAFVNESHPAWYTQEVGDRMAAADQTTGQMWVDIKGLRSFKENVRQTIEHEMGHIFDYRNMNDAARAKFEQIIGETRPWRAEGGNSPHEKFAEAYSLIQEGKKDFRPSFAGYDLHGNSKQVAQIKALISGLGGFASGGIAYVGDSLGVGTAPHLHGRVWSNTQVGRSSASGLAALRSILHNHPNAARIVFDLGTNDGSAGALRSSLGTADRISGHTPLYVPTVRGPMAAAKNAALRAMERAGNDIHLVDWAGHSRGLVGSDGIHASAKGYNIRAHMLEQAFNQAHAGGGGGGPSGTRSDRGLISQILDNVAGLAAGGMAGTDPAYLAAKNIYPRALKLVQGYASGGFTGPHGSLAWGTPMANFAKKVFGLSVTAGRTDHNRTTTSGNISDHSWGGALDLSNSTHPTPQMDGFFNFSKQKLKDLYKQVIYKHFGLNAGGVAWPYTGNDHFNHVHFAIQRQYANDPTRVAKILAAASRGVSINDMLLGGAFASASAGTGGGINIRGVPKGLRQQGAFGKALYHALRRKRQKWMGAGGGTGGGGLGALSGFHGGGSSAANMRLGQKMAAALGWTGAQWAALRQLWIGESGWRTTVSNGGQLGYIDDHHAYGIPQALPGTKMGAEGGDWKTNPATQIAWGLKYIKQVYGSPRGALSAWLGRSPHWYAAGVREVTSDNQPAMLHRGERILNPQQAAQHRAEEASGGAERRARQLMDAVLDIQDKIKKSERHLSELKDKGDKKKESDHLAELNKSLRTTLVRSNVASHTADTKLQNLIRSTGDPSSGEATTALVTREGSRFAQTIKKLIDPAQKTLTTARHTLSTARTHLASVRQRARSKGSPGGKRVTAGERRQIQRATHRVDTAKHHVTAAQHRLAGARAQGRRQYVQGAAGRGIDPKLIRAITGKGLTQQQTKAYSALAKAMRTGSGATTKELKTLRSHLNTTLKDEGKKARSKAIETTKEQSQTKKATITADHKREKAEQAADKRDKQFQKTALDKLEAIVRKDMSVNISNEVHGASIKTEVKRSTKRRR